MDGISIFQKNDFFDVTSIGHRSWPLFTKSTAGIQDYQLQVIGNLARLRMTSDKLGGFKRLQV